MIESLVESAGYTPSLFASAEEFLQSRALAAAFCLITDVRMPGIDGIEFAASR
jgi:FixJ family two-component response regulator